MGERIAHAAVSRHLCILLHAVLPATLGSALQLRECQCGVCRVMKITFAENNLDMELIARNILLWS